MIIFIFISLASASVSLKSAFDKALVHMETIQKNDALIEQAQARKSRALGTMGPTVSAVGNYTTIDPPPITAGARAFTLTKQYSSALRLDQPLLRGGSLSAYKLSKENILLQNLKKDASKITIAQQTTSLYFELLMIQKDLEHLSEMKELSSARLKEMRERAKVGRSRQSELSQTEAQFHAVSAEIQLKQRDELKTIELFKFITGLESQEKLELPPTPPVKLEGFDFYQSELFKRADILALNQEVQIAQESINVSKGGHLPSLDLTGNYYLTRTGILEKSDWDLGLRLNFPLYQGGTINAQVKEAAEQKRITELNSHELTRTLLRDLQILYQNYEDLQSAKTSVESTYKLYKLSYEQNRNDFRNGLLTNLELIQSMNLYIDSKRNYDNHLLTMALTYQQLKNHVGQLP